MPPASAATLARSLLAALRSALTRRALGVSAEEIRYTFGDVRAELRAARAEVAELRRRVEDLAQQPPPPGVKRGRAPSAPGRKRSPRA